nr:immunoglobulin light chain junction region [Macaca mulatta]MOX17721.1 immunoglobulin light chain junction region [Macaca mulatta]MOX18196.1 immunoglobulin light chain junction region [Macaca mulatta]MOX18245.1 immunoglobulin light chain junction region [Macaca mulatta]MOX18248.1 immunoglobulin light chain junction region [Macaca mulatta]
DYHCQSYDSSLSILLF